MDDKSLQIPDQIPMLPVRDIVIFPYMIIPLFVGRESSIQAVEDSLAKNRLIFLASQMDLTEENPTEETVYRTGTVAMIMRMRKLADGRVKILIQGMTKATVTKFHHDKTFFNVSVEKISEDYVANEETQAKADALIRTSKELLEKVIAMGKVLSPDILLVIDDINEPGRVADLIASNLGLKVEEAQNILETTDHLERLRQVNEKLSAEVDVLQMQVKIRSQAKDEMSKSQREYFLREQMKAIKSELGEGDSKTDELDELRQKLMASGMPEDVETEVMKQMGRLERMHPDASEASMIRTYLDWIAELPWSTETVDSIDIAKGKEVLEADHHGLEKAKERILEFLAVQKLKNNMKGPILCFCGPPGVGKTSLGKSIAKSMNRKYFRIALGGVKDEAEIRGHRRTYVGAMPGKIVQALKQIGTRNPVIVLDEIDKLGSDFRGDPSAAMLEVLDPEQNATFRDNYLNVDFDLSKCLFIATANVVENIPPALRDRMELIYISGYTQKDKLEITKKHLIRKQIDENGINDSQIEFTDEGISFLINHYTREAGLRNLEREVGSVCRKVAKEVVMGSKEKFTIKSEQVMKFLGAPKVLKEERLTEDTIGVTTGLAWTQAGGEVLYVEALKMKGKGGFTLTGQMGDVMKESATAAMSYARAHCDELGIDDKWFETNHVHIHMPAGGIPKDGPSAGVTMTTAIVSIMTNNPVRKDVAMTGEVTLSGRVLPIGGIKEKALAAVSHGIKTVICPIANKKDVDEISGDIRSAINFIFVEHLDEVLQIALTAKVKPRKRSTSNKNKANLPAA